jgi:type IV secretory pathway VirD2 relaxase
MRKAPEVMVKVTGGGKNIGRIRAHFDYISRNGRIQLENENGETINGREAIHDELKIWEMSYGGIPKEGDKRREVFNIMLSMPPGTNRDSVTIAVRNFASERFGTHQYVMATHSDEKHPHVHLCVKAVSKEGVRLNPRKADLQHWREHFADKLRGEGIAANATPRRVRGVVRKGEKQAVKWIDKGYLTGIRKTPSRARSGREDAIRSELAGDTTDKHPSQMAITKIRADTIRMYGKVARELAKSSLETDRNLALQIVRFVQNFPIPKTRQQIELESAREATKIKNVER